MALMSLIEAALHTGLRVETLEYLTKNSPKSGQARTLKTVKSEMGTMFDDGELQSYLEWLNEPWPTPAPGKRPTIPKIFKDDVKEEAHHGCAICGLMNNGEVAHIEAVSSSFNNAPSNLIFLCPNHHTKYDLGFKPGSNLTSEEVRAAKLLKRNSRCRILKYEANATNCLQSIISFLNKIEGNLATASTKNFSTIYLSEMKGLLAKIPELTAESQQEAKKDKLSKPQKAVAKIAPKLSALASTVKKSSDAKVVRAQAKKLVEDTREILIEIDEIECPRCGGAGLTGLVGDFCAYCKGACVVSQARADAYDPSNIDQVNCPRCEGHGTTGLVSDYCAYCHGSCLVSRAKAEAYEADEIDEVECPRCDGAGTTGLVSDYCAYCHGSCLVSRAKRLAYNEDDIDQLACPRCGGKGTAGLISDYCGYCRGSCVVSRAKYEAYDEDKIDEVECPHCAGRGLTGFAGDYCSLCKGSCVISREKRAAYSKKYGR
jgi:hypothetical protein